MQQDYAVYGDSRHGTVEALERNWDNAVGNKVAAYSRPVAVVGDQLIVEVDRGKSFDGNNMLDALDALGRDDVDSVALRVVEPKREQTLSRGLGR
jgi:hypothetical protein